MSGAYAVQTGFFNSVKTYVSASPQVGDAGFSDWYANLKDNDKNLLVENTVRLTNTADGVPTQPNSSAPANKKVYVHVGSEVVFTADYDDAAKNHNPCCTYSYALHNPTSPVNPDLTCTFPVDQGLRDASEPEFRVVHNNNPRITRKIELVTSRGAT